MSSSDLPGGWQEFGLEERERLKRLFPGRLQDLVRRASDGLAVPRCMLPMLDTIKQLQIREDDIFVVSFPKCGTTLTMELAWLLSHQADTAAAAGPRGQRCAFLEGPGMLGGPDWRKQYDDLQMAPSPRVFNTHLPMDLLPADILKARILWVGRSVKDACVSYYHHNRLLKAHNYQGDFPTFSCQFLAGCVAYGDFWAQLAGVWPHREHPRVKMLWYEELVNDRTGQISAMADFLGYSLTQQQFEIVEEFLQVDNYRDKCQLTNRASWNPGEGHFVRKGVVGDSRGYFSQEESLEWEAWAGQRLQDIGVTEARLLNIFGATS